MSAAQHSVLFGQFKNFLGLCHTLGHLFTEMCDTTERWSSDKVKENFETNLKVHCVMQLSLSYKVFRWHPLKLISYYSKLCSQLTLYSIYSYLILGLSWYQSFQLHVQSDNYCFSSASPFCIVGAFAQHMQLLNFLIAL